MNNPYQQYQNNAALTASPEQLTLMLYNGAIKFCNLALEGIEKRDIAEAHNNIMKVQAILEEFQATLDKKYPIAQEFDNMYTVIKNILTEANIKKDAEMLKEGRNLIRELRDLWNEIIKVKRKGEE